MPWPLPKWSFAVREMVKFNEQTIDGKVKDDEIVSIPRSEYERLQRQAWYDAQTGLMNSNRFEEQLRHDVDLARRNVQKGGSPDNLVLIYFDLNGLKYVNDTYGHENGNMLLREWAKVMSLYFRRQCDTVGRIGGDEFAAILPQTDFETARAIAKEAQDAAKHLGILVAYGMASYQLSVEDPVKDGKYERKFEPVVDDLKKKADSEMYRNKKYLYSKISPQEFYEQRFAQEGACKLQKEPSELYVAA